MSCVGGGDEEAVSSVVEVSCSVIVSDVAEMIFVVELFSSSLEMSVMTVVVVSVMGTPSCSTPSAFFNMFLCSI